MTSSQGTDLESSFFVCYSLLVFLPFLFISLTPSKSNTVTVTLSTPYQSHKYSSLYNNVRAPRVHAGPSREPLDPVSRLRCALTCCPLCLACVLIEPSAGPAPHTYCQLWPVLNENWAVGSGAKTCCLAVDWALMQLYGWLMVNLRINTHLITAPAIFRPWIMKSLCHQ